MIATIPREVFSLMDLFKQYFKRYTALIVEVNVNEGKLIPIGKLFELIHFSPALHFIVNQCKPVQTWSRYQ